MKKEYIKNYLGIVIQNNDPLERGRVKVWVPHVDMSVYAGWNDTQKNKQFNFPGSNLLSDLSIDIIEQLKLALPWAEQAMPIVGSGNTSGFYNAALDRGSISNKAEYLSEGLDFVKAAAKTESDAAKKVVGNWKEIKKDKLNELKKEDGQPEEKGKKGPPQEDDKNVLGTKPAKLYQDYPLIDAFGSTGDGQLTKNVNPYSALYRPMPYANNAQGSFAIPNVGSHVWLFFDNGDPLKPVIFAVSYGAEDWRGIYDSNENETSKGRAPDYPGTFENGLNKDDKDYKASKDDTIYRGKYSLNQRGGAVTFVNTYDREILNLTHFSGSFKEFNNYANVELATNNDQKLVMGDQFNTIVGNKSEFINGDYDLIVLGNYNIKYGDPRGMKKPLEEIKKKMAAYHEKYNLPFEVKRSAIPIFGGKSGQETKCPTCKGEGYVAVVNEADEIVPPKHQCGCALEVGLIPKKHKHEKKDVKTEECLTCGGSGKSPSTQDGKFSPNSIKNQIPSALVSLQKELYDLEALLGKGGDVVTNYGKNHFVTVGSEMTDFLSYRVDPAGKLVPSGVKIGTDTAYPILAASPLVEKVHLEIPPTGSYTHSIGFKYNLLVGSGGISLKTTGPTEIGGSVVTMAGNQVVISSNNEVFIDGGARTHITGDIISLVPNKKGKYAQVFMGGNLEVDRNMIVRGGSHIEGELSIQHITAPREYQATESEVLGGHIVPDVRIGTVPGGIVIGIVAGPIVISVPHKVEGFCESKQLQILTEPHLHLFANAPMTLLDTSADVRDDAKKLNEPQPKLAKPAVYCPKMETKMKDKKPDWTVVCDPTKSTNNSDSVLDKQLRDQAEKDGICKNLPDIYKCDPKKQQCVGGQNSSGSSSVGNSPYGGSPPPSGGGGGAIVVIPTTTCS